MISTPAQITIIVSNLINLKALEYFPAQRSILITQPLVLTILLFMHLALVAIHDVLPEKVVHLLVCIEIVDEVLLVVLGPDDSTLSRSEAGRDQVLVGGASLWRSLITRGTSTAWTRGAAWVQSLASILSMKQ